MLKGKVIQSKIKDNATSERLMKPSTKIQSTKIESKVEAKSGLKPSSTISSKPITVSNTAGSKPAVKTTGTVISSTRSNIEDSNSLYLNENYIRANISGFDPMFYAEIGHVFGMFDTKITADNIRKNLLYFTKFGDNVQRRVQNINYILDFLSNKSYSKIVEKYKGKSFFGMFKDFSADFDSLNKELEEYYVELSKSVKDLSTNKDMYFKNFDKLDFYFKCIGVIGNDLVSKGIISQEDLDRSSFSAKKSSLTMSMGVVAQFKEIYKHKLYLKTQELENIKSYLNTLKPTLELLRHNDQSEFKKRFEEFINS